jgi:hypothetical protein
MFSSPHVDAESANGDRGLLPMSDAGAGPSIRDGRGEQE